MRIMLRSMCKACPVLTLRIMLAVLSLTEIQFKELLIWNIVRNKYILVELTWTEYVSKYWWLLFYPHHATCQHLTVFTRVSATALTVG
jgi:hypothetical protein